MGDGAEGHELRQRAGVLDPARLVCARAPIKLASRIDVPRKSIVDAGTVVVAGVAWAQHTDISAVEVQVDDHGWQPAQLAETVGPDTWRQWRYEWAAVPGKHTLTVRATDAMASSRRPRSRRRCRTARPATTRSTSKSADAASVGNRTPPHGRVSGEVLSPRVMTTAADFKARYASGLKSVH